MDWLLNGALVGIAATIVMDAWALVAKHVLRLPTSNWALVGRWFGHMPAGVFAHTSIRHAQPVRGELALGWLGHYAIGIVYGVAYLQFARATAATLPAIVSALEFGLATLVFPWFVMQPALGGGVMASRAPKPNVARFVSVTMHTVFGLGLYAATALR